MTFMNLKTALLAMALAAPLAVSVQAASAKPATLDTKTALATNTVVLSNFSGPVYKNSLMTPVNLEDFTKAAHGKRDALKQILPAQEKVFTVGNAEVTMGKSGEDFKIKAGKHCHYRLKLDSSKWTPEGIASVYAPREKLPKDCAADVPSAASDISALTARLMTTPDGLTYRLPVAPDGSVVSAVLPSLAPTAPQDAGLYGYTYFVKYANGASEGWQTAGILGNEQVKKATPATVVSLIGQLALYGGEKFHSIGVTPIKTKEGQLMLKVVASTDKACHYDMFVDRPSVRHEPGLLSADFEAPPLPTACNGLPAPKTITVTVAPLDVGPQGSNTLSIAPVSF